VRRLVGSEMCIRDRVQVGRISRFGLLEMSRQRLRPSLGESSQIVCPRCTGHGHIRSTDSLALSILRLVEEEAMKEMTGKVIAQLPVAVATFLLNEKRQAIHDIQQRRKVDLTIIPNPYMETPHYDITRIRSDNLEDDETPISSYQYIPAPPALEDTTQQETLPTQMPVEAAVTNVLPSTPAPQTVRSSVETAAPPPPAPAPMLPVKGPGLMRRIFNSLFGSSPSVDKAAEEAESKAETAAQANKKPEQAPREKREQRRDRNERNTERGERGERNERSERGERGGERGDRNNNERRDRNRDRNNGKNEPTAETERPADGEQRNRPEQENRQPRRERNERNPERSNERSAERGNERNPERGNERNNDRRNRNRNERDDAPGASGEQNRRPPREQRPPKALDQEAVNAQQDQLDQTPVEIMLSAPRDNNREQQQNRRERQPRREREQRNRPPVSEEGSDTQVAADAPQEKQPQPRRQAQPVVAEDTVTSVAAVQEAPQPDTQPANLPPTAEASRASRHETASEQPESADRDNDADDMEDMAETDADADNVDFADGQPRERRERRGRTRRPRGNQNRQRPPRPPAAEGESQASLPENMEPVIIDLTAPKPASAPRYASTPVKVEVVEVVEVVPEKPPKAERPAPVEPVQEPKPVATQTTEAAPAPPPQAKPQPLPEAVADKPAEPKPAPQPKEERVAETVGVEEQAATAPVKKRPSWMHSDP
jgi:ribonuclease E